MAKLWQKNQSAAETGTAKLIEEFTVGNDRNLDLMLARFDILGSLAHTKMLAEVGLLPKEDLAPIQALLKIILKDITQGSFTISEGSEDIHSEIEFRLTHQLGDLGKKIHSGRSRNDQVLLDIKLFTRAAVEEVVTDTVSLFDTLIRLAELHKDKLLPGYTHLQLAMPSSFGLWFAAYAESLADDLDVLYGAFRLANKNPLGSGAGYGSSFPLDRTLTTKLLGFEELNYNVVYAQMNRGKMEKVVTAALANIAGTLARLAMDCTLYINQNFGFISFPDELTTGSSIMPHKKNPDVFELIRAKCNKLQNLPNQIQSITTNLPSGYHRDLQVIKEDYFHSFRELSSCLAMTRFMLQQIDVKEGILEDQKYKYLFTVDSINELVSKGMSFRDAYIEIGKQVEDDSYQRPAALQHTLAGSLGNLCLQEIQGNMDKTVAKFPFKEIKNALYELAQE